MIKYYNSFDEAYKAIKDFLIGKTPTEIREVLYIVEHVNDKNLYAIRKRLKVKNDYETPGSLLTEVEVSAMQSRRKTFSTPGQAARQADAFNQEYIFKLVNRDRFKDLKFSMCVTEEINGQYVVKRFFIDVDDGLLKSEYLLEER